QSGLFFFCLIIKNPEVSINTEKNSIMKRFFSISNPKSVKVSGMAGRTYDRTVYKANMDGIPNWSIIFNANFFCTICGAAAIKLVILTKAKEYVVDKVAGKENKYTKTGTVRMLPPPPNNPTNNPINMVTIKPMISIVI